MISVSRCNTYDDCPYKYSKIYEDGIRAEADYFDLGTAVHETLERIYRDYGGFIDLDSAIEIFNEEFNKSKLLGYEHHQEGIGIIESFLGNHDNFGLEILEVNGKPALEVEFFIDLEDDIVYPNIEEATKAAESGRKICRGVIDKVIDLGMGTIRIEDYKTSRVVKSQAELEQDLQLNAYNLAARMLFPWADNVEIALNFVRYGTIVKTYRTQRDAEAAKQYLLSRFNAIIEDNEPIQKLNAYCYCCDHRGECRAFQDAISGNVEIPFVLDEASIEELWGFKEELAKRKKYIEKTEYQIQDKISTFIQASDAEFVDAGKKDLYLSQNKRYSYPVELVLQEVPYEDLASVVSVTNKSLEDYFSDDKDKLEEIRAKRVPYYQKSTLRARKKS